MTLTSTTNRSSHTGNNSTTAFSYSFKVFDQSEIDVYLDGVKKTITTHYTVSGVGADAGGTVTFESDTVPGSGVAIVFVRNIAQTQTTDYTVTGQINPQTIEDALDKITMRNQKVQLNADESFGFADSVTDAGTVRISATSANRASKVLAFDSSGNLNADQEIGTSKGNWATSTAYVVRDIIKDTSNNNIYICLTAHTSSGSQPISSNTDSAKWRLLVDAASATTSQTAAAASATAAASSATAAASSASAASTSATNSASSATTSSTQASNSASSATSSASSATSSSTSATSSSNYATKVDGAVTGTDYSAKAWAVGGTGVTDTSSRGAAKEWATAAEDDQVDGSEYSAKHYATKAAASATSAASSAAGMEAATIKDGTYWGYTTAGSANTYTLTTSPTISSYAADMFYHIKVNASNTGASTINVDSVGAKNIKKYGGAGMVDLAANDLESGGVYTIIYDGTQFLLLGGSATDSQVDINTADIFMLNSRRLSDHSANVLNTVDGFVDDFQDGSTQNNTAINISGSTNIAHDNTSKYWQNSRGSAGQTTDTAYTTESNYTQQEWTTAIVGSSNATFTNSSATVTISSGTWPANCDNGRISQDGTNWYDIASRDSATQLTIGSNFGQSTVTGTYTIRMTEFSGGKVQLNEAQVADSNLEMLLHFNDSYDDSSSNNFSAGSWTVDTSETSFDSSVKKYGSHSLKMISGDGSTVCWAKTGASQGMTDVMNSTTWTIEWWIYTNNYTFTSSNTGYLFGVAKPGTWYANGSGDVGIHFEYGSNGFYIIVDGLGRTEWHTGHGSGSMYPSADTWTHFAVTRDGTTVTVYKDGTQLAQKTDYASDWGNNASAVTELRFGHRKGDGSANHILFADANNNDDTGSTIYFDDMRFTTDVKYTGNFTAPASEHGTTTSVNVITEPVTTVPTFATLKDSSAWSDLNSVAITDTPYDGSHTVTAVGHAKIKTSDTVDLTIYEFDGSTAGHGQTNKTLVHHTDNDGDSMKLPNDKTITSIAVYSGGGAGTNTCTFLIAKHNSSNSYDIVHTDTGFTHGNGGWQTKTFASPYTVPSTGDYYVCTHINASLYFYDDSGSATVKAVSGLASGTDVDFNIANDNYMGGQLKIYGSATVSPKFGTGMGYFDGAGDYLTVPADASLRLGSGGDGTGTFTIETWFNPYHADNAKSLLSHYTDANNFWRWQLTTSGGNFTMAFEVKSSGSFVIQKTASVTLVAGTWSHLRCTRDSSNLVHFYVGGSEAGSGTSYSGAVPDMTSTLRIGTAESNTYHAEGWFDDVRISDSDRGSTAPSSELSIDANTKLLLLMNGSNDSTTFVDSSYDTYHYYSVIHMPTGVSAYNDTNVKVVVWTGTVWKEVARYYSSAWQRNTDTADSTATTWTNATVNDMVHCISEAIENNTRLRMKEADVEGISDANWEAAGGLTMGTTVKVGMAVTMKSASTSGNATTDLVQFNYDGANLQGTFKTRVFGGTNMPPLAGSAPSNIVLEVIDKQISGTPAYKVSRDGGSNYDTISSWDIEDTLADGTTVRLADVTMAATSGTSPLVSIEQSGTGQDYRLYSLGLKYK